MKLREPPHEPEAERAFLSAVMLRNEVLASVNLAPRDFHDPRHLEVYTAICQLGAKGSPIDALTVESQLRSNGKLRSVGGLSGIAEIAGDVPTSDNIAHYAELIAEAARRRRLITEASQVAEDAFNPTRALPELAARLRDVAVAAAPAAATAERLVSVRLSEVTPERLTFLWDGRIPLRKLTIVESDPGLGKSTVIIDIIARATTGRPMPGETTSRGIAAAIIVTDEDAASDTIVPRAILAGADLTRVRHVSGVRVGDSERRLSLPDDIADLERMIEELKAEGAAFVLLVLDPIGVYISAGLDTHKDSDVRQALTPLAALADRTGAAVIGIRHLNKGTGSALYRGAGSIAFSGVARSVLLVAKDPDDPDARILAQTKTNLSRRMQSMRYRLVGEPGADHARVEWLGGCDATADDLTVAPVLLDPGAMSEALAFLSTTLQDGPVLASEVQAAARAQMISEATLRRAKKDLGVKSSAKAGKWSWFIPIEARPATSPVTDEGEV